MITFARTGVKYPATTRGYPRLTGFVSRDYRWSLDSFTSGTRGWRGLKHNTREQKQTQTHRNSNDNDPDGPASGSCSPEHGESTMSNAPPNNQNTDSQLDDVSLPTTGSAALWDPNLLEELYVERELTIPQIEEFVDCSRETVVRWLDKHDIETRSPGATGARVARPSYFTNAQGYEMAAAARLGSEKVDAVGIHRLVAVARYGFDAVRGKHVHHENEIPGDNRPSNLVPMTPSEHGKHHANKRAQQGDAA